MKRSSLVAVTVLFVAIGGARVLWGAASAELPAAHAAPAVLIAASEQTDRGKELFAMNCARCHGDQGQGTADGPRLIGSPNGLSTYMTAKGLFDFVSTEMPADGRGSLMPQVYWDILAFILDANKLLPPNVTLGPDNAASVRLNP